MTGHGDLGVSPSGTVQRGLGLGAAGGGGRAGGCGAEGALPAGSPHPAQSTSWRLECAGTLAAPRLPPPAGARRPSRGRREIHIRQSDRTGHPLAPRGPWPAPSRVRQLVTLSGRVIWGPARLGTPGEQDNLKVTECSAPPQDTAGFGGWGGLHFSRSPFPEVWEFVSLGVWRTEFLPLKPRLPTPKVSLAPELMSPVSSFEKQGAGFLSASFVCVW